MNSSEIDLDALDQTRWVTEAQYTGGSLSRRVYNDREKALESYRFLRDRADTDWQKLYEIRIHSAWRHIEG